MMFEEMILTMTLGVLGNWQDPMIILEMSMKLMLETLPWIVDDYHDIGGDVGDSSGDGGDSGGVVVMGIVVMVMV